MSASYKIDVRNVHRSSSPSALSAQYMFVRNYVSKAVLNLYILDHHVCLCVCERVLVLDACCFRVTHVCLAVCMFDCVCGSRPLPTECLWSRVTRVCPVVWDIW